MVVKTHFYFAAEVEEMYAKNERTKGRAEEVKEALIILGVLRKFYMFLSTTPAEHIKLTPLIWHLCHDKLRKIVLTKRKRLPSRLMSRNRSSFPSRDYVSTWINCVKRSAFRLLKETNCMILWYLSRQIAVIAYWELSPKLIAQNIRVTRRKSSSLSYDWYASMLNLLESLW